MTMGSVALSIQSMLSSAKEKKKPPGDAMYSKSHPCGSDPKKTRWLYDDDNV